MNDCSIAGVHPVASKRMGCCIGIVVVTLHDHVTANHDLAQRFSVGWNFVAVIIHHPKIPCRYQLGTLAGLDLRALPKRQALMLRSWFADRDERCGLCHSIYLYDVPSELTLNPLDSRRGRRRSCGD